MKINQDTLSILSMLDVSPGGKQVRIVEQLDRKTYSAVDKVLQALGGKWSRGQKAHLFDASVTDRLDDVITMGAVETARNTGFFETPVPIVRDMLKKARVSPGMRVLEPSAGTGRIVRELLAIKCEVVAVERDPLRASKIADDVASSQRLTVLTKDFLECHRLTIEVAMRGTATGASVMHGFDRVVMNPPFIGTQHLDHVRAAHAMLSSRGLLVSILPSSIDFRRDRKHTEFREWIANLGGEVSTMMPGSFKESGTSVATLMVVVPSVASRTLKLEGQRHVD